MPDPEDQKPTEETGGDDAGATDKPSEFAQPSTEDLADELNELEKTGEAETTTEETAPDPDDAPDAPADTEAPAETEPAPDDPQATPDETETAPDETDKPPDETDDAGDAEAEPDRTIAPPLSSQALTTSQSEKKAADKTRRDAMIAAQPEVDMSDIEAEDERKATLYAELEDIAEEKAAAQAVVDECQTETARIMGEIYPHTVKSDRHVDAVRAHIAAQKKIRAHRASNPERIKEILKLAGKAPIDAAFHRQRARGMTRPTRTPLRPGGAAEKPAADAGTGDKGNGSSANAGQE